MTKERYTKRGDYLSPLLIFDGFGSEKLEEFERVVYFNPQYYLYRLEELEDFVRRYGGKPGVILRYKNKGGEEVETVSISAASLRILCQENTFLGVFSPSGEEVDIVRWTPL